MPETISYTCDKIVDLPEDTKGQRCKRDVNDDKEEDAIRVQLRIERVQDSAIHILNRSFCGQAHAAYWLQHSDLWSLEQGDLGLPYATDEEVARSGDSPAEYAMAEAKA